MLLLLLLLLLRALHQHEEVVVHRKPSNRVVGVAELCEYSGYRLCVSHGSKAAVSLSPDGEKKILKKNNN